MLSGNLYSRGVAGAILLLLPFILFCSSAPFERSRPSSVIGYVNIKTVYEHVLSTDRELAEKREKRKKLQEMKKQIVLSGLKGKEEIEAEIKNIDNELSLLAPDEDAVKLRLYKKISSVVRDIARRRNLDMVLNIGDSLVYARKEFDITDDVIEELEAREERVSPEWK